MIKSNKKINFVNNLRDLGNKKTQTNNTIRDNLFIRCAAPINLSAEAQKQMMDRLNDYLLHLDIIYLMILYLSLKKTDKQQNEIF